MKILVLADDDGVRQDLGHQPADLLISLGDLSDMVILQAAKQVGCKRIFAVKGNHDSGGPFPPPIIDLHFALQSVGAVSFGGFNGSWRYKPKGHFLYEQEEVDCLLAKFPPVDVFVAHNSPGGVHERDTEVHAGFEAFNGYIKRAQPRLFLHGHQHVNQDTLVGRTQVMGVYGQRRIEIRLPLLQARLTDN
jgi:predicted phosphodiesterase